jgi:N-acetylmuramic acid 6-phosphate etherase
MSRSRRTTGPATTPEALDALLTEQADPRYAHLDEASVVELAALMNDADASVPAAIGAAMGSIVPAIEAVTARLARGGRLRYVGAGTAGRMGVLDASECPPTFGVPPDLVRGIIAGGHDAILAAQEGAEDDLAAGARAIATDDIGPLDAVVGVAASGRTPFVIGALREARSRGALTVALSCNTDAPISREAGLAIEIPVGPEVLAGSTRLKAGTAQKLVLNMISTIAMVRLGKTWGNLMVDLRATNEKLRERAIRIVQQVTGASREAAIAALRAADWEVKPAALVVGRGMTVEEARRRLAVDGRLRAALEEAR